MTIGIYKLNFKNTDKMYVGQSANIEQRYKDHIALLKKNSHSKKLQEAYLSHGTPTLEILCECNEKELDRYENEAIEIFDSVNSGFNTLEKAGDIPKPDNSGDKHGLSKYSNDTVIKVFKLLVESPNKTAKEISIITEVHVSLVNNISSLYSHTWLKEMFPKEYEELIAQKGNRLQLKEVMYQAKFEKDDIIKAFNLLVDCPEKTFRDISIITNLTIGVIKSISNSSAYSWLEELFKEKYEKLRNLKGNRKHNIVLAKVVSPYGVVFTIMNITKFAKENSLSPSNLCQVIKGNRQTTKGWRLYNE